MKLVWRRVLGLNRQICMISDRHAGLINAANEEMEGFPPLVHRWCMRHFAANLWRRQKKKEAIDKLKVLCMAEDERTFDKKFKDLDKILNEKGRRWLQKQMPSREKWALAFDEGGWRYGIMTTNGVESLNYVFKGIRSRPVAGIVSYSFEKCNKYFVHRWEKADAALKKKGVKWGRAAAKYLDDQEKLAADQQAEAFGPHRMVYSVKAAGGTNRGGERHGGRKYKVDLRTAECTCNIPQLLHVPCSHMITACTERGVDFTAERYMSPYYLKENTVRVWSCSFEPYLDPSCWPEYTGPDYVPDRALMREKKGRRKTKRLKGDMDMIKGYGDDPYGTGDFDQPKSTVRCSKCHQEGHRAEWHKKRKGKKKGKQTSTSTRSRASSSTALAPLQVAVRFTSHSLMLYLTCSVHLCHLLSICMHLLTVTTSVLFVCRMAHARFPLFESEYDDAHRAHLWVDEHQVCPAVCPLSRLLFQFVVIKVIVGTIFSCRF
jgi:hypothetical protein